jgi:hypothetical protein
MMVLTETRVGLHVNFTLLDFNQSSNVSAGINRIPQYQVLWKFLQLFFPSCFPRTDEKKKLRGLSP